MPGLFCCPRGDIPCHRWCAPRARRRKVRTPLLNEAEKRRKAKYRTTSEGASQMDPAGEQGDDGLVGAQRNDGLEQNPAYEDVVLEGVIRGSAKGRLSRFERDDVGSTPTPRTGSYSPRPLGERG